MKKLLFAIAGTAAFAAFAADPAPGDHISIVGFENYTTNQTVVGYGDSGTLGDNSLWSYTGEQGGDSSTVQGYPYADGDKTIGSPSLAIPFPGPFADGGDQFLKLDTNGAELQRAIPAAGQTVDANGTYIDTLVQFTPSESAPTTNDLDGAKLAIWLGVENDVTNLCVQGAYYESANGLTLDASSNRVYKLNKSCDPGTWYRLTVKAIATLGNAAATGTGESFPGFVIMIDGEEVATSTAVYSTAALTTYFAPTAEGAGGADDYLDAAGLELLKSGKFIPSLDSVRYPATLTAVGFKGTGALDDFVVTTEAPDFTPAGIDFTLTWPQGYTPVSYTIDGGTPVTIDGNTTFPISVPDGSVVAFTFTNADGATKTMSATASSSVNEIDASTATYVWADYLGAAVNGAYTIDDAADLDMLRKGVLNTNDLTTVGVTFKQTANIDMSQEAPFEGIGLYWPNLDSPTNNIPFEGTYDGQGFTISNITLTDRDYAGVFNQVRGGTIKNLTVDTITFPGVASKCSASIVGNAGLGSTLQGLTAAGSFGTSANPCKHNVAGIAIRLSGGANHVVGGTTMKETLVKDCTNNAALYGTYTKMGGICTLTQDQNGVNDDYVLFDGCVNNGTLTMPSGSKAGQDGLGGIVAYVADGTKLQNCVNTGAISSTLEAAKKGELIGWAQGRFLDDLGGNAAASDKPMIGDPSGSTITGFEYATVANNVATTVLPPLSAGGPYLLERNVAASETPVATLTAVGSSISFDTALGYTFAGTVAGSGAAGYPTASTSGTVTTYTAGYFPRTATAGQDGSASNPFEIADEDDLLALQAAVANNVGRNLAYVQTADIALTALWQGIGPLSGKDLSTEDYAAQAFAGTYDGGNYTISNFQMYDAGGTEGTDYGALFNAVYNATIKNLKISWGASTLTPNSSSSGKDTGATFVGTAKGSTLQNLTALAGTVTTVTASKDMAGIVGFVYAGSTIEACTNELNITSFKTSRKCGGIAVITQSGSGDAIFRNCYNSGTITTPGTTYREGGIVGYINVATTIDGCENTANVKLFHVEGSPTVTVTGTNKGYAGVASNDKGVSGLYFATVDGNVATFVADNALALNGSYKVMSAGATATFAFAEAGTIAFNTNLVQAVTFAITAAEGLTLTDATADGVVTYTAASQGGGAVFADDGAEGLLSSNTVVTANDIATYVASVTGAAAPAEVTKPMVVSYLLSANKILTTPETDVLKISAIEQVSGGWKITVTTALNADDVAAGATVDLNNIVGDLSVTATADLGTAFAPVAAANITVAPAAEGSNDATITVTDANAKFLKATVTK